MLKNSNNYGKNEGCYQNRRSMYFNPYNLEVDTVGSWDNTDKINMRSKNHERNKIIKSNKK